MTKVTEYVDLYTQLLKALHKGDDTEPLLGKMDTLWESMTDEEAKEADDRTDPGSMLCESIS